MRDKDYCYTRVRGTQVRTIKESAVNETQVTDITKQIHKGKVKMLTAEYTDFKIKQEHDSDFETGT